VLKSAVEREKIVCDWKKRDFEQNKITFLDSISDPEAHG
jgi:hypothetical protein